MADTLWFDGDQPVTPAHLVEDEDGDWAISNDPALPVAGRIVRDADGDFAAVPGVGPGLPVNLRFAAPSVIITE